MNKYILVGVVAILVIAGGWWYFSQSNMSAASDNIQVPTTSTVGQGTVYINKILTYPANDEVAIAIDYKGDHTSKVNLDGWSVRSAISGKSFTIEDYTLGDGWDALLIHTVGSPPEGQRAEGGFEIYFGETVVAWGHEHDTIELINSSGVVVDTYSY